MNHDRRQQIIDLVNRQKVVKNNQIMEMFDISIETVRRDLEYLEQQGYLRRVYGGAVANVPLGTEPEYARRVDEHAAEKSAIAREAAKLVSSGDSVFLGFGTTVQAMAPYLKGYENLTVFTNALRVAIELNEASGCSVIVPGGQLRKSEWTLSGFPSGESISHFNISKAFIGVGGVTAEGVTDYHIEEARLQKQIINNAAQTIILVDSSKLGVKAMTNVCSLDKADVVITDSHASNEIVKELEENGVRVVLAKV